MLWSVHRFLHHLIGGKRIHALNLLTLFVSIVSPFAVKNAQNISLFADFTQDFHQKCTEFQINFFWTHAMQLSIVWGLEWELPEERMGMGLKISRPTLYQYIDGFRNSFDFLFLFVFFQNQIFWKHKKRRKSKPFLTYFRLWIENIAKYTENPIIPMRFVTHFLWDYIECRNT